MSSQAGRLREVVAYESWDHIRWEFCLISICYRRDLPNVLNVLLINNTVLAIEKYQSLVRPSIALLLQHLIIQFWLYYLSSRRLREVENKRNFQTFGSKNGRGRLQEVSNIVIWLGNVWYFGKLVAEERWSLTRGGRNRRFDCTTFLLHWWLSKHFVLIERIFFRRCGWMCWKQHSVWQSSVCQLAW